MPIEHVFLLVLENRSFDHLFGFSGLEGVDAVTGAATRVDGVPPGSGNAWGGTVYPASAGAPFVMPADPGHEFADVLEQLCGAGVAYSPKYPRITSAGFASAFARKTDAGHVGDVLRGYQTAEQLPVLYTLAREFAICDRWFSSIPGPTWPNRMFFHAASSGGLDHTPSIPEMVEWETVDGFAPPRGTIFQALTRKGIGWHVYSGDDFPMVTAFKGLSLEDASRIDDLVEQLGRPGFPHQYVFIEPGYDILRDYRYGSSQHPLGDVRAGEALVKQVYEALRRSEIWERSLLVIAWDEHGGFYDHVAPPTAVSPGDGATSEYNQSSFTFEQYGVRTPAIVVSPLIPRGVIDHRTYDHASVPATLEALFGLEPLTERDRLAANLLSLPSLDDPRDTLDLLPDPRFDVEAPETPPAVQVTRPGDPLHEGALLAIVHSALRAHLQADPNGKPAILDRVKQVETRADVLKYLDEVRGQLT